MVSENAAGPWAANYGERIEVLARIAAQVAGFDPDANMTVRLGNVVAYDGPAWRYGPHLQRAARALLALQVLGSGLIARIGVE